MRQTPFITQENSKARMSEKKMFSAMISHAGPIVRRGGGGHLGGGVVKMQRAEARQWQ